MSTFSGPQAAEIFERYLRTITGESDRGAVLVAASLLDAALECALKKKLVPAAETEDRLFTVPSAPLRSFSAKIEVAFRLGLITRETKQMLNVFRKLRNDFAHGADEITFDDNSVKDRLRAVFAQLPIMHSAVVGTLKEALAEESRGTIAPDEFLDTSRGRRIVFNAFFASTAMALRRIELEIDPISELK